MHSAAEPLLACTEVGYAYLDRYPALDAVTCSIHAGEAVALVGANGCGKSTLLKILDGLVHPAAGGYRAFGVDVTEDSLEDEQFSRAFRSRIGFVFQSSDSQVFCPTVREELAFGPLQLGLDRDEVETRVDDVLALLEIDGLAGRSPFQLSGGQRKRVAIGSVLTMNPDVLLFDEPTAALDPRSRHWLCSLLSDLHAAGKTLILATHDLDVLPVLATRCLVLGEDHRLVGDTSPGDLLGDRALLNGVNLVHDTHRLTG